MKRITYRLLFTFTLLAFFTTMSAQVNPPKRSAKEVAETGSQADRIHAKKIQQKQLKAPPTVIAAPDSVHSSVKKSPAGKKAKKSNRS